MGKPRQQGSGWIKENSRGDRFVSGNATRTSVDRKNHTHFHKDGVTVTHEGRKTSVLTLHCDYCQKTTKRVRKPGEAHHKCVICGT